MRSLAPFAAGTLPTLVSNRVTRNLSVPRRVCATRSRSSGSSAPCVAKSSIIHHTTSAFLGTTVASAPTCGGTPFDGELPAAGGRRLAAAEPLSAGR